MRLSAIALLLAAVATAACSRTQLGLPAVPVRAASPDGAMLAFVRNHASLDPPNQSLWLRRGDGRDVRLWKLSEDQDWCNRIVWSGDGRTVAFLVQDARLLVADSRQAEPRGALRLVEDHNYPTTTMATDVALSNDGTTVSYRICSRENHQPGQHRADCGPIVTRPIGLGASAYPRP